MTKCKLGLFLNCPHPEMIESVALSGFDFAVVDMEHSPISQNELYPLALAAECRKLQLVVRVPMKFDAYFKWCRDLNISHIQVPHIETVEDAQLAIRNFFFSPKGERGLSRFVRAANYSLSDRENYIKDSNEKGSLILQIEGMQGIKNLEPILESLPKDVSIFIGPYDLSQSMGMPGQIWDKRVTDLIESVILRCSEYGVSVGTFTDSVEGLEYWSNKGVTFLEYASDLNVFIQGAIQVTSKFSTIISNEK